MAGAPWAEFRSAHTDQVSRVRNALLDIVHVAFVARRGTKGSSSRDRDFRLRRAVSARLGIESRLPSLRVICTAWILRRQASWSPFSRTCCRGRSSLRAGPVVIGVQPLARHRCGKLCTFVVGSAATSPAASVDHIPWPACLLVAGTRGSLRRLRSWRAVAHASRCHPR